MNPTQPDGRFSYANNVRQHIEYSFNNRQDFHFDTEKFKIPYTLVIRKTNNEYTRMLQNWKSEKGDMRTQLDGMRTQFMFDVLGGDVLQVAAGVVEGVGAQSLQPMSASIQNRAPPAPVVGMKRKADVVDLTED